MGRQAVSEINPPERAQVITRPAWEESQRIDVDHTDSPLRCVIEDLEDGVAEQAGVERGGHVYRVQIVVLVDVVQAALRALGRVRRDCASGACRSIGWNSEV
jgi:hypothetical protein